MTPQERRRGLPIFPLFSMVWRETVGRWCILSVEVVNNMVTVKTFATSLRAASLVEDMNAAGFTASYVVPAWKNRRMPPPKVEVMVPAEQVEDARRFVAEWK